MTTRTVSLWIAFTIGTILAIPLTLWISFFLPLFLPAIALTLAGTQVGHRLFSPKICIIEDDEDVAILLQYRLKSLGFNTLWCRGDLGSAELLTRQKISALVLDWKLESGLSGATFLEKCNKLFERQSERVTIPVITFSAVERGTLPLPRSRYFFHAGHFNKFFGVNPLVKCLAASASR